MEALQKENEALKKQLAECNSKLSVFEVGAIFFQDLLKLVKLTPSAAQKIRTCSL